MNTKRRSLTTPFIAMLALGAATTVSLAIDPNYTLVNQQVGINAVTVPADGYTGNHDRMTGGMSVGDFNNDTWADLYISGLGTVPDMLYINQQDGTFIDEAASYGIDFAHFGVGSAVGDVNNDGYQDLYIVSYGPSTAQATTGKCLLYINNGPDAKGRYSFSEQAVQRGVNDVLGVVGGKGACFGDIDLDGDLDLYVATWQFFEGGNRVFQNDGTGQFTDITTQVIPQNMAIPRGFTPKIVDVTGDRYPELLLTCDFGTSLLLVNNGPDEHGLISFRDSTDESGITTDNNGMGSTIADYNGDGILDWFMTNIYVSTANFFNTLFMGLGVNGNDNPVYLDQATQRGVGDIGWGWGVASGDYDNDGDVDIVATSGWPSWPSEPTRLWSNDGLGNFADISNITGLTFNINGRGLIKFDYDKDGDLDLAFVDNGGPFRIYRNELGFDSATRYLRINVNTDRHPCVAPMGYGTRVIATYAGKDHLRVITGESGYLGQSELTLHYGTGNLTSIDSIRFEWADGSVTTMDNVATDQEITVYAYHPLDLTMDGTLNYYDISALIHAFKTNDPTADINGDQIIDFADIMDFINRFPSPCQ